MVERVRENPDLYVCWCRAPIRYVTTVQTDAEWEHPGLYCSRSKSHLMITFNYGGLRSLRGNPSSGETEE